MKILFDQGVPVPLQIYLGDHEVDTAFRRGWQTLENGQLLAVAEVAGYDILVTTDQNLRYQQNLQGRKIAIVVLLSTSWPRIQKHAEKIALALDSIAEGDYCELPVPDLR
ncbi:MAG: hypothetical protein WBO10_04835 [Pyrinomonadaceae bacterium]